MLDGMNQYFEDTLSIIISIFNNEFYETQPRYIIDMSCGNGSLLKQIYKTILTKTKRSQSLDQHPLLIIGVNCNQKTLKTTKKNLKNIPHLLLEGNVTDLETLVKNLHSHGISDIENALYVQSRFDQWGEADIFLIKAAEVGLFPRLGFSKNYPQSSSNTHIYLHYFEKRDYQIKKIHPEEISYLIELEKKCWEENLRVGKNIIRSRIKKFPEGQFVIKHNNTIIAAIYTQRINNIEKIKKTTYKNISKLNTKTGSIAQLLAIVVDPDMQGRGYADQLLEFTLQWFSLKNSIEKIVAVTRCQNYKNNSNISLKEYIQQSVDSILQFHISHGAKIVDLIPNYRPEDDDNQGTGILIEYAIRDPNFQFNSSYKTIPEFKKSNFIFENKETIKNHIYTLIANSLPEKFHISFAPDLPLREMGFDSLGLIDLKLSLNNLFHITLDSAFFFTYPTPAMIANYFTKKIILNSSSPLTFPQPIEITSTKSIDSKYEHAIAIIGIGCRFPGNIENVHDYWHHLEQGLDLITEVPESRWKKDNTFLNLPIHHGGFLSDIDRFDANFFRISPREAKYMDPQQRILLEVAWQALEHAGIDPQFLHETRTGIYFGIFTNDYEKLLHNNTSKDDIDIYYSTGNSISVAAGRLSYALGLQGPAITVNTACSSSLVAVHLACQSLRQGESHLALAGGVNIILTPELSVAYAKAGMLSPDGRCKTFDASANGYVRSEGCGIIVLKKYVDAIADQDQILAVIRGSAVNQDGSSNGLTAPNKTAQVALIRQALADAKLSAGSISYVEAHGTGTALGDPVEVKALVDVYCEAREKEQPLLLGSVKTNLGHTEAAAGIAGLIKVVLSLMHKKIPAHLHFKQLNSHIDFHEIPICIPTITTDWPTNLAHFPKRGGISSFGFSGTNAHVVIEEAPEQILSTKQTKPYYLLTLSAKHPESLKRKQDDLAAWLTKHLDMPIEAIAYTLNAGRSHFNHRAAFVVSSIEELQTKLEEVKQQKKSKGYFVADASRTPEDRAIYEQILKTTLEELKIQSYQNGNEYKKQLETLANLYTKGYDIDWIVLHQGEAQQKISLPTYPFMKERYWYDSHTRKKELYSEHSQSLSELNLSNNSMTYKENVLLKLKSLETEDSFAQSSKQLDFTSSQKHYENVIGELNEILRNILDLKIEIDIEEKFVDYGLDSILGVEIIKIINQKWNLNLPVTKLYDYPTTKLFVTYLTNERLISTKSEQLPEKTMLSLLQEKSSSDFILPDLKIIPEKNTILSKTFPESQSLDIAIIGVSGQFPGADNIDTFWSNLEKGRNSISEISERQWSVIDLYNPEIISGKINCKWGGFLTGIDQFDPGFFKITPLEAEQMDPQQRLFLEACWHVLEDAGYSIQQLANRSCGVFVGVRAGDFYIEDLDYASYTAHRLLGSSSSILAARAAYLLDLTGPAIAIDTACSSSLVALHQACQSIRQEDCEMAIAGGVSILHSPNLHIMASQAGMLSPDGQCKAFDDTANGFVPAEGVGVILLKSLSKALADKDRIYGVIKGSGINQDGATNGITAPSARSQEQLLSTVYKKYDINPRNITYVEAHGTGTKLGDPIEAQALMTVFKKYTDQNHYCALGSVKSNIGHTITAAGVASVIKVLLCLQHKKLVPSLHFNTPNGHIPFKDSPFYINTEAKDWESFNASLRLAAISSFGFSGTNAHIVIEEAPEQKLSTKQTKPYYLLTLSAKHPDSLKRKQDDLAEWLTKNREMPLEAIAYTLNVGRSHFNHRMAFVVSSIEELQTKLDEVKQQKKCAGYFAGDASHAPEDKAIYKQVLESSLDKLKTLDKKDIAHYKDLLEALGNLYVKGYEIDWIVLHVGEANQKISLPTYPFMKERCWIPKKSQKELNQSAAIAQLHPLIGWNASTLESQCFKTVFKGNEFYFKDHRVETQGILPGVAYLEMARAAGELAAPHRRVNDIRDVVWLRPLWVNDTACEVTLNLFPEGEGIRFELSTGESEARQVHGYGTLHYGITHEEKEPEAINSWMNELDKTVLAKEFYAACWELGLQLGVSFRALQWVKSNAEMALGFYKLPSVLDYEASQFGLHPSILDGALQTVFGLLFHRQMKSMLHVPFALGSIRVYQPISYTGYTLARTSKESHYDIQILNEKGEVCVELSGFELRPAGFLNKPSLQYYIPHWVEESAHDSLVPVKSVWVFSDDVKFVESLTKQWDVPIIQWRQGDVYKEIDQKIYQVRLGEEADYVKGIEALSTHGFEVSHILFARGLLNQQKLAKQIPEPFRESVVLIQALLREKVSGPLQIMGIYTHDNKQKNNTQALGALWIGFAKSLRQEHPRYEMRVVGLHAGASKDEAVKQLKREWEMLSQAVHIRYEEGKRYLEEYTKTERVIDEEKPIFREHGVYLITGGLGGLGLIVATHLAKQYQAKLILTGRSLLDETKEAKLDALKSLGAEVLYISGDVAKSDDVTSWVKEAKGKWGSIQGVIHSAGILRDGLLIHKAWDDFVEVLSPKVIGTWNLDQATKAERLDCFILFSSVASCLGSIGQSDYASGNAYLDYFAYSRMKEVKEKRLFGKTVSINWPYWSKGGMQVEEETERYWEMTFGMKSLPTEEGLKALHESMQQASQQCIVLYGLGSRLQETMSRQIFTLSETVEEEPAALLDEDRLRLMEQIKQSLRITVSETLKIKEEMIDDEKNLSYYGFDSITFTELANRITKDYAIRITPALFFEYSTIARFAGYLCEVHSQAILSYFQMSPIKKAVPHTSVSPVVSRKMRTLSVGHTSVKWDSHEKDIAIIGMSGHFPGTSDADDFWKAVTEGRDLIRKIPKERFDCEENSIAPWAGLIDGIDQFDASFFNISPYEAELMDPQQWIFLQTVFEAIEDAGYAVETIARQKVGLFVGVGGHDYSEILQAAGAIEAHSSTGTLFSILANRVSYLLNLTGPSEAIDTACSSSLVALHRAVRAIQANDCQMALVGGVNALLTPTTFISFTKAGMLSPDGRCKTFDKTANGYVRSEGVGAVVLKRLSEALADGDRIYGVIKGVAVNHGGHVNTLTAPNPNAQAELIIAAYKEGGISPDTIGYIEAHGTGTSLGDPIEINGLKKAFKQLAEESQMTLPVGYCGLGSVKANIGHLESAAGIAGIIKSLCMLRARFIPPQAHFEELNPYIELADSPFYIASTQEDWKLASWQKTRRVGISSFGFGGVNGHVVIEEAPEQLLSTKQTKPYYLLTLSARHPESLKRKQDDLAEWLTKNREMPLEAIAYTLNTGRSHFNHRVAFVVSSNEELQTKLDEVKQQKKCTGYFAGDASHTPEDKAIYKQVLESSLDKLKTFD